MRNTNLVDKVASSLEKKVESVLSDKLKSFYLVGSYSFGKISQERPDINFLIIFDKFTTPHDYLAVGEVCRSLEEDFSKQATIKIEFRPFRYIKPRYRNELEISVNPILTSTEEIQAMGGVIFSKWFTEGLKNSSKLFFLNSPV